MKSIVNSRVSDLGSLWCIQSVNRKRNGGKAMHAVEMDIREIELMKVSPCRRFVCDEERIGELVRSIRALGQLEPIRVWFAGEHFRILDGEKRWRACKKLGLRRIKVAMVEVVTSG